MVDNMADPFLRAWQLVRVLDDWSPSIDGVFLYYPGHRQVPLALRALIDMLRAGIGSPSARGSPEIPVAAEWASRLLFTLVAISLFGQQAVAMDRIESARLQLR
jgi:hypothetical protein